MLGELKIEPISVEDSCICFIDTGLNEEKVRAQFLSRGHKFSIPENFPSIRDFTSTMRLHFRSDLVGVALVGARPLHLLSQIVLPLKSPTGAFIAPLHLRKRELAYGRRSRLILQPKKNRKFPLGNSLSYLSCVDFCGVRLSGCTLFFILSLIF